MAKAGSIDEHRVYLAGQGDGAAAVFYVAVRVPDLWAAAVALGGTPRPAIDSNRLYAANTHNVPVLWLFAQAELEATAKTLKSAGYNLEWRRGSSANLSEITGWLAAHRREEFPVRADCETGSPAFSHCYWIHMTKFDPAQRNDVLESTRVQPGSGAALAAGPFGFNPEAPGPGVTVASLPNGYKGPLQVNDRIVAIGGKALSSPREFLDFMDHAVEEKSVVLMVERGSDRLRIETQIVLPKRTEVMTARVVGEYLPQVPEVRILSRAVTEMRVTIPPHWAPSTLTWNGSELAKLEGGGCWLLSEKNQLLHAQKCQ